MGNESHEQRAPLQKLPALKAPVLEPDTALVEKILQKTADEKIIWTRKEDGHDGRALVGSLTMELRTQTHPIFGIKQWSSFSVLKSGKKILSASRDLSGLLFLAGASTISPLHKAISELSRFLEAERSREVLAALDDLESL